MVKTVHTEINELQKSWNRSWNWGQWIMCSILMVRFSKSTMEFKHFVRVSHFHEHLFTILGTHLSPCTKQKKITTNKTGRQQPPYKFCFFFFIILFLLDPFRAWHLVRTESAVLTSLRRTANWTTGEIIEVSKILS